jgi:hypothetical protein
MATAFASFLVFALCLWAQVGAAQVAELDNQRYNAPYRNMAMAYAGFDTARMTQVYTSNCVYAPEGGNVLLGHTAVQAMYSKFLLGVKGAGTRLSVSFALIHRSVQAGVVTDVGYYRLEQTQNDGFTVGYGKFITQSIEKNGVYRFVLDTDRGGATEADFLASQQIRID